MAYIEVDVEEIYIELSEARRKGKDQVGLLKKSIYGLVHTGLLRSKAFGMELKLK